MKSKTNSENESVTILIAEDSKTQAEQLKYLLEKQNYNVIVANNGKEALEVILKVKPSLVISDIVMPEMNGYELCKEIKSSLSTIDIPVILLTSLSRSEDVLEGISCGADNFITKPYREDYLISHIEQILANTKLHYSERVRIGVEIFFGGKRRFITAGQQQMLTLLISTYEAAVQKNDELVQSQDELKKLNDNLEGLVIERTAELSDEIEIRKRAEERIIKLNRVYAVLSNINQAIVRIHDTQQLFNKACLIAVEEGKFQSAWIGLVDTKTKKIETSAFAGLENRLLEVSPNQNPIVTVIKSRKSYFSNNIEADNDISEIWKKHALSLGFRSFIVFPLLVLGKVIGCFCIYANEIEFFDEIELNLLDEMATDISFALEFIQNEAERKHTVQALQNSEARLSLVFNNTSDMQVLMEVESNNKLRTIAVNHSFLETLKKNNFDPSKINNIIGKYRDEVLLNMGFSQEHFDSEDQYFQKAIESGISVQYEHTVPLGKKTLHFDSTVVPVMDTAGRCTHILYSFRDITDRKLSEVALRRSEEKFSSAFRSASYALTITNASSGKIIEVNDSFYSITGYSIDETLGKTSLELNLWVDENDRDSVVSELMKGNKISSQSFSFRRKSGEILIGLFSAELITIQDEKCILSSINDITKLKNAEEKLIESEERYKRITDGITDYLYTVKIKNGKAIETIHNDACHIITGYTPKELSEEPYLWINMVLPEERELVAGQISNIIEGKDISPIEHRIICKNGKIRWVSDTAIPKHDANGELISYEGVIKDITERKYAEEKIQRSEAKFKTLFENANDAIFLMKGDTFDDCNLQTEQMFGCFKKDILSRKPYEFSPPFQTDGRDSKEKALEMINAALSGVPQSFEWVHNKLDGTLFDAEVNLNRIYIDDNILLQAIVRDITGRKRAEKEITMLAHSLKSVNECVSITDVEDNILFVNQSFLKTYGYPESELLGKNIEIVRSTNNPPELIREILPATSQGGWKGELWNKRKDGSEFPVYLSTTVIKNKNGKSFGLIGVAQDITERKRAEKELIEAKVNAETANKLKDAFINNMSHEVRTPLNGILGLTSLIKENYARYVEKEDESLFTGIDSSAQRIIRTVDMILNYSRLQTGEFTVILKELDILEICTRIIKQNKEIVEKKNFELIFDNQYGEAKILGDEYTITHVVSNLVDNAIKYTKHGSVNVTLLKGSNDDLILEVKDSGIGINQEYLEHLFEPYRQEEMGYGRAYEGVGLGLALTKKYVELNHAVLSVESKKGEGTTFTVTFTKTIKFPLKIVVPELIIPKVKPAVITQDRLVLIVEDDILNQVMMTRFLKTRYTTRVVSSADEAMEILSNNKVDIILMDISIDGPKNGLELTGELKAAKEFQHIPVIAVSAHAFERDRQNALEAGCNDYIAKPFSKDQLFNKIEKFLNV